MLVNDICANRFMNRDRNVQPISGSQHAVFSKARFARVYEVLAHGLAKTQSALISGPDGFMDVSAGLFRYANLALTESGRNVFRGGSRQRDFEIVNQRGAVHGKSRDVTALHEIDQDRAQTHFDHVPAQSPDDRLASFPRPLQRFNHPAETLASQNSR